jgi:hypothetical protein
MNEKKYQEFLKEKEVNENTKHLFLTQLKDYETYLLREKTDLDSVNPKKLIDYTEYLIANDKKNVLDFLRAILSYADFSKKYDFISESIDIFESYNAMDNLYARIAEIHGKKIRDEIFSGLPIPPLGAHPEKKPGFTKQILERMEKKLGEKKTIELLSPCLHGRPPDDIEGDKKLLAELGIDIFLKKKHQDLVKRLEKHAVDGTLEFAQKVDKDVINFIKNNQMFGSGVRKGEILYISKIPYQTKRFLTANDEKLKKFYLCYCPWVRGALKDGTDDELSNSFCHCSAGWYKLYWDQIFEKSIDVKPIKSALKGDLECSFTIKIPEKFLNNNA